MGGRGSTSVSNKQSYARDEVFDRINSLPAGTAKRARELLLSRGYLSGVSERREELVAEQVAKQSTKKRGPKPEVGNIRTAAQYVAAMEAAREGNKIIKALLKDETLDESVRKALEMELDANKKRLDRHEVNSPAWHLSHAKPRARWVD